MAHQKSLKQSVYSLISLLCNKFLSWYQHELEANHILFGLTEAKRQITVPNTGIYKITLGTACSLMVLGWLHAWSSKMAAYSLAADCIITHFSVADWPQTAPVAYGIRRVCSKICSAAYFGILFAAD